MAGEGDWTFYCDESGASGMNLIDPQQPIYVAGGVLAPSGKSDALAAIVSSTHREHKFAELKAALLLKRKGGEEIVDEVIEQVFALGCMPFFVISEKRHNVAQKIVDVLMDPEHNNRARWLSLFDDDGREKVANQLLRLPDAVLEAFAEAYREPALATWKHAIERLALNSRLLGLENEAVTLEGALGNLEHLLEAEDYGSTTGADGGKRSHRQYAAICAPYFCHVVHMVDALLEAQNVRGGVIHDQAPKFEDVFRDYFSMLQNVTEPRSVEWRSGTYRRNGISRLKDLRFEDSTRVLPLQLADLVCGRVRHAIQTTVRDGKPPPFSKTVLKLLLLMFDDSPIFGRITASEAAKERLYERVAASLAFHG